MPFPSPPFKQGPQLTTAGFFTHTNNQRTYFALESPPVFMLEYTG